MNTDRRGMELLASLRDQIDTIYNTGGTMTPNESVQAVGRVEDAVMDLISDRRERLAYINDIRMRARAEEAQRIAYISETGISDAGMRARERIAAISEEGMRAREEERVRITLRLAQAEAEAEAEVAAEAAFVLAVINPHPWVTIRQPRTEEPALTLKMKVIKKALLDAPVEQDCPICFENPLKKHSIETTCGHTYCHDCFNTHANNSLNGIRCPMCRAECKQITGFKQRGSRSQEIPVLDLTEEEPLWTSFLA